MANNSKLAAVRLDVPGVVACGPYKAGKVYRVGDDLTADEAQRLVDVKHFTALTADDIKDQAPTEPAQAAPTEAAETNGQPAESEEG